MNKINRKKNYRGHKKTITEKRLNQKNVLIRNLSNKYSKHFLNPRTETLINLDNYSLDQILFFHKLYKKILKQPGSILELGVQFAPNTFLLQQLRKSLEPKNVSRRIIAIDTFSGFKNLTKYEKKKLKKNMFSVPNSFYKDLVNLNNVIYKNEILKKTEIIKGKAEGQLKKILKKDKSLVFSLIIFNMNLYKPTINCLKIINKRILKGSIIFFNEFACDKYPGETQAVLEFLKNKKYKLKYHHGLSYGAYIET